MEWGENSEAHRFFPCILFFSSKLIHFLFWSRIWFFSFVSQMENNVSYKVLEMERISPAWIDNDISQIAMHEIGHLFIWFAKVGELADEVTPTFFTIPMIVILILFPIRQTCLSQVAFEKSSSNG